MTNFTPKINVFVENDYNRNSLFKHTTIKERTSSLLKNTVKIKVQNQSFSKSTEFTKFNDIKYILHLFWEIHFGATMPYTGVVSLGFAILQISQPQRCSA